MPPAHTDDNVHRTPAVAHSKPIPIAAHGPHPRRPSDAASFSSDSSPSSSSDSSVSPTSPYPATPLTHGQNPNPRIAPLSPSTSPILSYFLSQSPKSPTTSFPFRRNFPPVVAHDDAESETHSPLHRRASMATWPDRGLAPTLPSVPSVPIQPPSSATAYPDEQHGRAARLLRRLSLGGPLVKPQVPSIPKAPSPPTSPIANNSLERTATVSGAPQIPGSPTPRKTKRANTLAPGSARPPRAPSPMGERILKGHFDGFN